MASRCCNLLVIPFFLIVIAYATPSIAAGQWDGVWAGQLDVGNCNWNMPFEAAVNNGAFRAESDVMTTGSQFRLRGKVRASGKLRAHGTVKKSGWSETIYIRGKFSAEKDFNGRYNIGRCQGNVYLSRESGGPKVEELVDIDNIFQQAVAKGDLNAVKQLIAKGATVNVRVSLAGRPSSLLHVAIQEGHIPVAELLIANGADVHAIDPRARTPLHWAAYQGLETVADLLIEKGANLGAEDLRKRTPLHWAAGNGHQNVAERLIASGADTSAKDEDRRTPLHWAALGGHAAVAELLITNGANVNAKAKKGIRPLALVAEGGHEDLVKLLKQHGAKE